VTPSWRESSAAEGAFFVAADSRIARNQVRRSLRVLGQIVPAVTEP